MNSKANAKPHGSLPTPVSLSCEGCSVSASPRKNFPHTKALLKRLLRIVPLTLGLTLTLAVSQLFPHPCSAVDFATDPAITAAAFNPDESAAGRRVLAFFYALPPATEGRFFAVFSSLTPEEKLGIRSYSDEFWIFLHEFPFFIYHVEALAGTKKFNVNMNKLVDYFIRPAKVHSGGPALTATNRFLADRTFSSSYQLPPDFQLSSVLPEMEAQLLLEKAGQTEDLEKLAQLKAAYRAKSTGGMGLLSKIRLLALEKISQDTAFHSLAQLVHQHPELPKRGQLQLSRVEQPPQSALQKFDTCDICLTSTAIARGPSHCECLAYCKECIVDQMRQTKAQTGAVSRCPNPVCQKPLEREFFEKNKIFSAVQLTRFDRSQLAASALERVPNWRACPTPECIYGVQAPRSAKIFEQHFQCPACDQQRCLECSKLHLGRSCKGEADPTLKHIMERGARARAEPRPVWGSPDFEDGMNRPCPHCGKIAGRADGCNTVRCSECRSLFHWNHGKIHHDTPHDWNNLPQAYTLSPEIHPHF